MEQHIKQENNIDFVLTWVDGNDPAWQQEKARCSGVLTGDTGENRYRDWDNLHYWFRSVEKYAPWVHRIYFVTWGHVPSWLNRAHPKLCIVNHRDFIPEKYLPTFSSRTIDFFFHRIPGLSEQFVYFNDDMFLTAPVKPEDFFLRGQPRAMAALDAGCLETTDTLGNKIPLSSVYTEMVYNTLLINRNFSMRRVISRNPRQWFCLKYGKNLVKTLLLLPWWGFPGFQNEHLPYSFLKSTFEKVWAAEPDMLESACANRFRQTTDVGSVVIMLWQIAEGNFIPRARSFGAYCPLDGREKNDRKTLDMLRNSRRKVLCLNDECPDSLFEERKKALNQCFEQLYPNPSAFELSGI